MKVYNAEIRKNIGERIRDERKERGWTQKELAKRIGTSSVLISYLERGIDGHGGLTDEIVNALASVLGCDKYWLLGESESRDGNSPFTNLSEISQMTDRCFIALLDCLNIHVEFDVFLLDKRGEPPTIDISKKKKEKNAEIDWSNNIVRVTVDVLPDFALNSSHSTMVKDGFVVGRVAILDAYVNGQKISYGQFVVMSFQLYDDIKGMYSDVLESKKRIDRARHFLILQNGIDNATRDYIEKPPAPSAKIKDRVIQSIHTDK